MSGAGGSREKKPPTKGKEDVKCNACDKVIRKDEMKNKESFHLM